VVQTINQNYHSRKIKNNMKKGQKLTEENSWKVIFHKNPDDQEGYLFASANDANNSAREFCKYFSPDSKAKLAAVNGAGIRLVSVGSEAYAMIIPPELALAREFYSL